LTTNGAFALRYNTEAPSCPEEFKLAGNELKSVELTLELSAPGVPEEFAKKLNIHVIAENKQKSLYVAPIYASYALKSGRGEEFYPQVWSVVNHKQIGKRSIIVASQDGELEFSFEGPGAQFFAFTPTTSEKNVKVFEKMPSGKRKLVFDSSENQAYSEYFEVLKQDLDKKTIDSKLECDENDANCKKQEQRFAEFNAKSKQASTNLLDSITGNEPFNKNFFEKLREKAKKIANTTVFWRSFQQQLYCRDVDDNGVPCAGRSTDPACCRSSIYDWVNVTTRTTFGLQQCVFCNNTWRGNPPVSCEQESDEFLPCTSEQVAVFNCDQRCVQTETGGVATVNDGDWISLSGSIKYCEASKYKGITSITQTEVQECKDSVCPIEFDDSNNPFCFVDLNGDGFIDFNLEGDSIEPATLSNEVYSCANGKKIAVSKQCTASCDNWCAGRSECDASCDASGLTLVETGSQEALGQTPGGVKLVTVKLDSSDPAYQKFKLLPRKLFSEYGDPLKFSYNYSINTVGFKQGKAVSLKQELGLSEVNGCSESQKHAEEGSFLVTQENNPEVGSGLEEWLLKADVITIPREKYLGEQCLKNDAKWNSVALCAPLYADRSPLYGACINNLALLDPQLLELTFFGRLAVKPGLFVYPIDSQGLVIQGKPDSEDVKRKLRGFFLSERGYAVAFRDSSKTGNWFSGHTITQDFDFWNPLGRKARAKQMVWKTPWYKTGWFKILLIAVVTVTTLGILNAYLGTAAAGKITTFGKIVQFIGAHVPVFGKIATVSFAKHVLAQVIVGIAVSVPLLISFWPSSDEVGAAGPCMPGEAKYALFDAFGNDDFENSDIGVRGCKGNTWQACAKNDCSRETKD